MTDVVLRPRELQALRRAMASGLHAVGLAVQGASMRLTPVHGDPTQGGEFATFAPGEKPIGGTLRRSHYTATFLDGELVDAPAGGVSVPDGVPVAGGITTIVGTSAGYGLWVHEGTSKMAARPYLMTGFMETKDDAPGILAANVRRKLGQ